MTATVVPTMVVEDAELCLRPSIASFDADPIDCDHLWEPHLCETGRVHCLRCGSFARWVNDPRAEEASSQAAAVEPTPWIDVLDVKTSGKRATGPSNYAAGNEVATSTKLELQGVS